MVKVKRMGAEARAAGCALALQAGAAWAALEDLPSVKNNLDRGMSWVYGLVVYGVGFAVLGLVAAILFGKDVKEYFPRVLIASGLLVGFTVLLVRLGVNLPLLGGLTA